MTTMAPPRTDEMRRQALQHANHIRTRRAELKRTLKQAPAREAALHAANLILNPPDWLATMRLDAYLRAVPKIGRVRIRRLLPTVTPLNRSIPRLKRLSDRQREHIANWLRDHAEKVN